MKYLFQPLPADNQRRNSPVCVSIPTFTWLICLWFVLHMLAAPVHARENQALDEADRNQQTRSVSPSRRIQRNGGQQQSGDTAMPSIDGANREPDDPRENQAHTTLRRFLVNDYADGADEMAGQHRPGARQISNTVFAQDELIPNPRGASDFLWQWGQFIDHDLDLTDGTNPPEPQDIAVPLGDAHFDPDGVGQSIPFNRSLYAHDPAGVRQQVNEITGWIDASNVYGSSLERAQALRTLDGSGKLKTSAGDLLPFNTQALANAGGPSSTLFVAGDVRANEQVGLLAMHTLFVREHNRWVDVLAAEQPELDGDQLYLAARALVAAQMQKITYEEFLPALLGRRPLAKYKGYRAEVDARILNEFSTAAFRLGHSMLSPTLLRLDEQMQEVAAGHLPLRNGFFAPQEIIDHGIESLLRGLSQQICQNVDSFVIDDVRNFLFGNPGQGGFDLVSLNIQRGRDHGLPGYNAARVGFGLAPAASFADISSNPVVVERLQNAYAEVDDVDFWVGGLAEDTLEEGLIGELFAAVVIRQFTALRDGDRYWYQRTLSRADRQRIKHMRLADIIRLNTQIADEIGNNVFNVATTTLPRHNKR